MRKDVEKIGRYKIIEILGSGGSGCVYKAYDSETDRHYAIKSVSPRNLISDRTFDETRKRFDREASLLEQLKHPNIISIIDRVDDDNGSHIVLEYINRISLDGGKLYSQEFVLDIMLQTAKALEYAHGLKVIHRDIKPDNLLIGGSIDHPIVKLTDFGIAHVLDDVLRMTTTGEVIGTFFYMAPEQVEGLVCDERTDLYSLGLVGYELLSGKRAQEGDSPAKVIGQIMLSNPIPPSQVIGKEVSTLDKIILKLLRKDPNARYQSATDLILDLESLKASGIDSTHTSSINIATGFSPLVGREKELSYLVKQLSEAKASKNNFIFLFGPTGIGKTRLLSELTSVAKSWGIPTINAQATKYDSHRPFGLIGQITLAILGKVDYPKWVKLGLAAISENMARYIGVDAPDLNPKELSHLIEDAFTWLIQNTCKDKPLLITIDDAQWADKPSTSIATSIINLLSDTGLIVVFAINSDNTKLHGRISDTIDNTSRKSNILNISPLSDEQIKEYVQNILDVSDIPDSLVSLVQRESCGNPMFANEIITGLACEGTLRVIGDRVEMTCVNPDIPKKLIQYQNMSIANLDEATLNLVSTAAMIGPRFSVELLAEVANISTFDALGLLDNALRSQILRVSMTPVGNVYYFTHERTRQQLVSQKSTHFRQTVSHRVATSILKLYSNNLEEHLESLIYHFGNSPNPYRAVPYLTRQSRLALKKFQRDEALRYANTAFRLSEESDNKEQLIYVYELLSDIHLDSNDLNNALKMIEAAVELAKNSDEFEKSEEAILYRKLSKLQYDTGKVEQSLKSIENAFSILYGSGNMAEISRCERLYSVIISRTKPKEALNHAKAALATAEETNDLVLIIGCLGNISSILRIHGKTMESYQALEKAVKLGEDNGLEKALEGIYANLASFSFNELGDSAKGRMFAGKARNLAKRTGNMGLVNFLNILEGFRCYRDGFLTQAKELLQESMEFWDKINQPSKLWYTQMLLAWVFLEEENILAAESFLERSKKTFRSCSEGNFDFDIVSCDLEIKKQKGEWEEAKRIARESLASDSTSQEVHKTISLMLSISDIYVELGDIKNAMKELNIAKSILDKTVNVQLEFPTLHEYVQALQKILEKSSNVNQLTKILTLAGVGMLGKDIVELIDKYIELAFLSSLSGGSRSDVVKAYILRAKFSMQMVELTHDVSRVYEYISTAKDSLWKAFSLCAEIEHNTLTKRVNDLLLKLSNLEAKPI